MTPRIMAFTATKDRPDLAVRCALMMRFQHRVNDHFMWVNGTSDYSQLVRYMSPPTYVKFGMASHQHINHVRAIRMADINQYDLFLKIDDDDFYGCDYVNAVARSFQEYGWDFSGTHSEGLVVNGKFNPTRKLASLGASATDKELGVAVTMPPTYAFSRKAIQVILDMKNNTHQWEDVQWRQALKRVGIDCFIREESNFIYSRHQSNTSTTTRPRRVFPFSSPSA